MNLTCIEQAIGTGNRANAPMMLRTLATTRHQHHLPSKWQMCLVGLSLTGWGIEDGIHGAITLSGKELNLHSSHFLIDVKGRPMHLLPA